MTDQPRTTNRSNTRVTMAVLGTKLDHLTEKVDGIAAAQEKLWAAHVQVHADQETRIRFVESQSHDEEPLETRVRDLEKWQEGQKVRNTVVGVIQTSVSSAIASLTAFLQRPPS